jgi:small subunit ribosomal protein S7e
MANARSKIVKRNDESPSDLELEVAKALFDIEVSPSCDFKAEMKEIVISSAEELEVKAGRKAVIVHFPYKSWRVVSKIHGRLIRELEKKLSKRHVIFTADRTMINKNFRRLGIEVRPRSRTLTSIHESILEDIVSPLHIGGKRIRMAADSTKMLKVILDVKEKERDQVSDKLDTFSAAYLKLTNKPAVFAFEA